ncbi:MAG: hypothetical protein PGN25_05440 [Methylorubrum populi]
MSNVDFLGLHASAAGFRIMVLANRLGCTDERERALHDWLERQLAEFIGFARAALAAERRFILNTDPGKAQALGEDVWYYEETFIPYWCEGAFDLRDRVPVEMQALHGILDRIDQELGIFVTARNLILPGDPRPVYPDWFDEDED